MALMKYRSSWKKVVTVTFMIVCGYIALFIIWMSEGLSVSGGDTLRIIVLLSVPVVIILLNIWFLSVELGEGSVTYRNFWIVRRVPIERILGIGLPEQNWLIETYHAHMYVWYDDPEQPGRDRYIQLRRGMFDESTLVKLALDIQGLRPNIKFDARMESFVKKWTPVPDRDTGKGFWHFMTKKR